MELEDLCVGIHDYLDIETRYNNVGGDEQPNGGRKFHGVSIALVHLVGVAGGEVF